MRTISAISAGATAISAMALYTSVSAGEPAALVLEVSGAVQAAIGVHEEVPAGTVIELGDSGRVMLSHYGTCEEIALSGGRVTIGEKTIEAERSRVDSRTAVDCPATILASAADLIAMSMTLRSAERMSLTSPRPEFVLVGAWGKNYDMLGIYGRDGTKLTIPVSGGRASWPETAAALQPGQDYIVLLNGPDAQQFAARLQVDADHDGLTLLKEK